MKTPSNPQFSSFGPSKCRENITRHSWLKFNGPRVYLKLELSFQLNRMPLALVNQMAPLALVANFTTRWCQLHLSCKIGHQMVPLALVAILTTRWRHLHNLQICPPDGATCIAFKVDHQIALLLFLHCSIGIIRQY